jgi:hypothetical protein
MAHAPTSRLARRSVPTSKQVHSFALASQVSDYADDFLHQVQKTDFDWE